MPVYKLDTSIRLDRNSSIMNFDIDLHVSINEAGGFAYGEDLWKVSAWLAESLEDEATYGLVDQVNWDILINFNSGLKAGCVKDSIRAVSILKFFFVVPQG